MVSRGKTKMKTSQLPKDIIKLYLPEFDVEETDCLKTLANAKYSAACRKPLPSLYPSTPSTPPNTTTFDLVAQG